MREFWSRSVIGGAAVALALAFTAGTADSQGKFKAVGMGLDMGFSRDLLRG